MSRNFKPLLIALAAIAAFGGNLLWASPEKAPAKAKRAPLAKAKQTRPEGSKEGFVPGAYPGVMVRRVPLAKSQSGAQAVTKDKVLCGKCFVADTFWTRLRGLQYRPPLEENEGLFITNCPSVHMIGVRFPIDVIFLTADKRVTDWVEDLSGGFHFYIAKARDDKANQPVGRPADAIELPAGSIARQALEIGDEIGME